MVAANGPASWVGQPRVKGSSEFMKMFLLTFSMIGLQFCWGTEMAYATPYLLALGLSKSMLSLVWVAGPLSGLVMQPVIGAISDQSRSKYGRRRPFMVFGSVAVAVCLVLLGWASEIVGWFTADEEKKRMATALLAVVDIYVLDFMINIAQSTSRALVVDTLPVAKQQLGSAWAGRMAGVGNLLMYAVGALDLNGLFGNVFGNTQFKKLCLIAAFAMVLTQGITCWAVQERVLVSDGKPAGSKKSLFSIVADIYRTTINVPPRIQAICWVQFWSWIGWFPFLFYGTTWIGEIYLRRGVSDTTEDALTRVGRVGSTALIVFSIISFIASIVLPWMVRNPEEESGKPGYGLRGHRRMKSLVHHATHTKPSLVTAWMLANVMFASSMIFAPLVQSVGFATFLMAFCGVPWAIGAWASGAFIGIEVNKLDSSLPTANSAGYGSRYRNSSDTIELDGPSHSMSLHVRHASTSSVVTASTGELSGIYLGILNIYTTLPQFVGTGISWIVFSILEPGKSPELAPDAQLSDAPPEGLSGISVCLFIGAVSAAVAAYATRRLRP